MRIRFELTPWIAQLAGTDSEEVELPGGATIEDALRRLGKTLPAGADQTLIENGSFHASVMVLVNDTVNPDRSAALADGDVVRLMLPAAGG